MEQIVDDARLARKAGYNLDNNTFYEYDSTDKSCLDSELDSCESHTSCTEEQSSHASVVEADSIEPRAATGKKTHTKTKSGTTEREWTSKELDLLRQYYPTEASTIHLRIPRHTLGGCRRKASLLGIHSLSTASWSAEEDAVLMEYYPTEGNRVAERLTGRTPKACVLRAGDLGIKSQTRAVWSAEEDAVLQRFWAVEGRKVAR